MIHRKIAICFFLVIAMHIPGMLHAQSFGNTFFSTMDIGLGSGYSFQLSDTKNSKGFGAYFSFGWDFRHQPFYSMILDSRFSIQYARNSAFDHRYNNDLSFNNVLFEQMNLDFELGFHSSKFLEPSRVGFRAFLGIGLYVGYSSANLRDQQNNEYDYSIIDTDLSRRNIVQSVKNFTDDTFETTISDGGALLPAAGLQITYKISPVFRLNIGHKMHFSIKEEDCVFGANMDGNEVSGSWPDITNLTSIGVEFTFDNLQNRRNRGSTEKVALDHHFSRRQVLEPGDSVLSDDHRFNSEYLTKKDEYSMVKDLPDDDVFSIDVEVIPRIEIQGPDTITYRTGDSKVPILASIRGVENKENFIVQINNEDLSYVYDPSKGLLKVSVSTFRDTSNLKIVCWNKAGEASEERTVYFKKLPQDQRPVVSIIQPITSPYCKTGSTCLVQAEVHNINSATDITVTINGEPYGRFEYSFSDQKLKMSLPLKIGKNKLTIKAENELGTAEDQRIIIRESDQCMFPEFE